MKSANLKFLDVAKIDLSDGYWFSEKQQTGLGKCFLSNVYSDIELLRTFAGIHRKIYGKYCLLSMRFPFAIYDSMSNGKVYIFAVVDCRRNPAWIREKLR